MENKGFNFLAGLGGLYLIWKLYTAGWLHRLGFLAINYTFGSDLVFNTFGDFGVGSTPLAIFAALIIDAITIFGSLLVLALSGIWSILLQAGSYLQDLFAMLREYLKKYINKNTPVVIVEPIKEENTSIIKENVKETVVEVILEEIKKIRDSQAKLEEDVKILKGETNE